MPATFIVFRSSGPQAGVGTGGSLLSVDATLHETHTQEAQVTEHPVERGANITDHIRPMPRSVAIDGYVTNTPPKPAPADKNRVKNFRDSLDQLLNNGTPCTLMTALHHYDNMVLKSLSIPRDSKTAEAFSFTATFIEIRTVDTETIELPKAQGPAKPIVKKGNTDAPKAPEPVKVSGLKQIQRVTNAKTGLNIGFAP